MFHNRVCWGVSLENADKENKKEQDKKTLSDYLSFNNCNWLKKQEAPQCIRKKASLTVEAAIILPLIAGVLTFFLFYFRIMQIQFSVQGALEETGQKLAVLSMREYEQEEGEDISYLALAKGSMLWILGSDLNIERYVIGGALGICVLNSQWENDDLVLRADYSVKFPIGLLGRKVWQLHQSTTLRKWTGWHAADYERAYALNVYVTKYGEVYHMRQSCPHLALSIQKVHISEVENWRNRDGEIYESCRDCCLETDTNRNEVSREVYVTDYGACYHLELNCNGLKRTVYQKKLSEVGDMRACAKCWK